MNCKSSHGIDDVILPTVCSLFVLILDMLTHFLALILDKIAVLHKITVLDKSYDHCFPLTPIHLKGMKDSCSMIWLNNIFFQNVA